MVQEAPDEFSAWQADDPLLPGFGIAAHPEAYVVAVDTDDPLIRDRHPVRIAAQIVQHRLGAAQRLLGHTNVATTM